MEIKGAPGSWQAVLIEGSWVIRDRDGRKIATPEKGKNAKANARLTAMSPYTHEALRGLVALIGDEDLGEPGNCGVRLCATWRVLLSNF